jgi:hypothetical protein
LEEILKANTHIIDEFSWVTAKIQAYDGSHISGVLVDDIGNHMTYAMDLYGLSPNYFESAETSFTTTHLLSPGDTRASAEELLFGHPNQSELALGDQLYTPRGSQGAGSALYF